LQAANADIKVHDEEEGSEGGSEGGDVVEELKEGADGQQYVGVNRFISKEDQMKMKNVFEDSESDNPSSLQ